MSDSRPLIPADMKRELRREACYGCICCGNPIIEYHHIKDWCIVKEHTKENLAVLCPKRHYQATVNALSPERIIQMKKSPCNSKIKSVSEKFFLDPYNKLSLVLGSNTFNNARTILRIHNDTIISFNKDEDGYALLNLKIYDQDHNIIAQIKDNEWITFISDKIWDISFLKGILDIRCSAKKLWLKISTDNGQIKIDGRTYSDKGLVIFDSKKGITIENYKPSIPLMHNSTITTNYLPDNIAIIQIGNTILNTGSIFFYE